MTGRKHRANMELVAQGIANMASALFGGISVTGTIARTATNIRAGAQKPPLRHHARGLPATVHAGGGAARGLRAALGVSGCAVVVCWNMAEKAEFARLLRQWQPAAVLLATFGVTLLKDLTFGILAGCLLQRSSRYCAVPSPKRASNPR